MKVRVTSKGLPKFQKAGTYNPEDYKVNTYNAADNTYVPRYSLPEITITAKKQNARRDKNGRLLTKQEIEFQDNIANSMDWLNNSVAGDIVKILDPTGISSWQDAADTFDNPESNWFDKSLAVGSVIPLVGPELRVAGMIPRSLTRLGKGYARIIKTPLQRAIIASRIGKPVVRTAQAALLPIERIVDRVSPLSLNVAQANRQLLNRGLSNAPGYLRIPANIGLGLANDLGRFSRWDRLGDVAGNYHWIDPTAHYTYDENDKEPGRLNYTPCPHCVNRYVEDPQTLSSGFFTGDLNKTGDSLYYNPMNQRNWIPRTQYDFQRDAFERHLRAKDSIENVNRANHKRALELINQKYGGDSLPRFQTAGTNPFTSLPEKGHNWDNLQGFGAGLGAVANYGWNAMKTGVKNAWGDTKDFFKGEDSPQTPCPEGWSRDPMSHMCVPGANVDISKTSASAKDADAQYGSDLMKQQGLFKFGKRHELNQFTDRYNQENGTNLQTPSFGGDMLRFGRGFIGGVGKGIKQAVGNPKLANAGFAGITGLNAIDAYTSARDARRKTREFNDNFLDSGFQNTSVPVFRGNFNNNTGMFQQDRIFNPNEGLGEGATAEDGGQINNTMKIRITGVPDQMMAYGGQTKFGLDLNRRAMQVEPEQNSYDSISDTLTAVPREQANIEAEGGETVYGDLDGDGGLEHMKISGPRHTHGGVPLNVPQGSFVFSDTRSMRIKDPKVLSQFSKSPKKGGYTPAELAKQYDINKFKAIMEDPNADPLSKYTAQLMVKNYQKKLGNLAMVQEGMKGFPGGPPEVAKKSGVKVPEARYGGYSPLPTYQSDERTGEVAWTGANSYNEYKNKLSDPRYQEFLKHAYNIYSNSYPLQKRDIDRNEAKAFLHGDKWKKFNSYDEFMNAHYRAMEGAHKLKEGLTHDQLNTKDWDYGGDNRNKVYNNYARRLGINALNEGDIANHELSMISLAQAAEDPRFKNLWRTQYNGKNDHTTTIIDSDGNEKVINASPVTGVWGNTLNQQLGEVGLQNEGEQGSVVRYRCVNGEIIGSSYPSAALAPADSFETEEQAKIACPDKPNTQGNPKKQTIYQCVPAAKKGQQATTRSQQIDEAAAVPTGWFTTTEAALAACPKGNGWLLPDKINFAAAAYLPPQKYMPYGPDLQYRPSQLALEDWQAQAQNLQQNYNSAANTLGAYQPGQALASNLSYMAGQTANNIGQAIAGTTSRNVDRYNRYAEQQQELKMGVDKHNLENRINLYDKGVLANQNYDNARRRYVSGLAASANNAIKNRAYLNILNATNPSYNIDENGRVIFTGGRGNGQLGTGNGVFDREARKKELKEVYHNLTDQQIDQMVYREEEQMRSGKRSSSADDYFGSDGPFGGGIATQQRYGGDADVYQFLQGGYVTGPEYY